MIIKDFALKTKDNDQLNISAYGCENLNNGCLIFVHGFKGFKDWGFGPYLARYFAEKGLFVLTFNFSHNGIGSDPEKFTEIDKFAENTFSREISELSEIIDAYENGFFGKVNKPQIALLGHSRGGAIALLTAYQKREVKAVALWASISKLDRYSLRQKEQWKKDGFFEVVNQRTAQVMRLNVALLEDIEKNKDDLLNIERAVKKLNRPLLIAHGEQDLAVPVAEADQIFHWSDKSKTELFKIQATGHTFDIKHPFEGSNDKFEKLLNKTYEFLENNLIKSR